MVYRYNFFLKPLAEGDTTVQIVDNNGIVKYSIDPFSIINIFVKNNIININIKGNKILINFSTANEAKISLPLLQERIDKLKTKIPNFIDKKVENYIKPSTNIKGGLHTATSSQDRDNIIFERRDWGMLCYVIDDDETYQLRYGFYNTDIMDNNNWDILNRKNIIITYNDKNFIMPFDTFGDGQFTGLTISQTPVSGCYVGLFVNGQEFEVGSSTNSSPAYFSNDDGLNAKNNIIEGDGLYWNGNISGTDLLQGWRLSLYYLV
jgi:hypothetical protein